MFTQDQIRSCLELALKKAEEAFKLGNYPIGSVIVDADCNVIAAEMNESTTLEDLTAHAEILSLRKLGKKANKNTPDDHFLFTSLEPCHGCSFFISRSNIRKIYSALRDPYKGGMSDLKNQESLSNFFKNIEITNNPFKDLADRSRVLMKEYFLSISNTEAAKYYDHREIG